VRHSINACGGSGLIAGPLFSTREILLEGSSAILAAPLDRVLFGLPQTRIERYKIFVRFQSVQPVTRPRLIKLALCVLVAICVLSLPYMWQRTINLLRGKTSQDCFRIRNNTFTKSDREKISAASI